MRMGCEHENGVILAFHSGEWTAELRQHAAGCTDCGEALRVAEALREQAGRAEMCFHPPDPHWIFERSRRRAREMAVRRVRWMMASMRVLAGVYVLAAAGWLARGYAEQQYRDVASALHGSSSGFALLGVAAAAVCVAAGLWPILHADRP